MVKLKLRDTAAPFTFTLINVHTDPSPLSALRGDLNALGRIYQTVQANDPQDDDIILLGDLNSDPSSFWGLGNVSDLVYAVPDSGTMVHGASRNDNIVFQWRFTGEDYTGRAGVFRVAQFLGIWRHTSPPSGRAGGYSFAHAISPCIHQTVLLALK